MQELDFGLLLFLISIVIIIAMGIIIYRQRTSYKGDSRMKGYYSRFNDVLLRIAKAPVLFDGNWEEAALLICKEGCEALGTHCISIWALNEEQNLLIRDIAVESDSAKNMMKDSIDMAVSKEYLETLLYERAYVVNDAKVKNELSHIIDENEPTLCAYIDAPIRVKGNLYGVICVEQHQCDAYPKRRKWTEEEQAFVSSLADLLAQSYEIAERKKLEIELHESNNQMIEVMEELVKRDAKLESLVEERTRELTLQTTMLSTLLDSIPDQIFVKDLSLNFLQANKSLLDYHGIKREYLIGKNDIEGLGVPEEIAELYNEYDLRVMSNNQIIKTEEPAINKEGSKILFETTKVPLIQDGAVIGVLGIAHDITVRKAKELEIAKQYEYTLMLSNVLSTITKSPCISHGDIDETAKIIAQKGCIALNTDYSGVWKLSESNNVLINITCYTASSGAFSQLEDFGLSHIAEYEKHVKSDRAIVFNSLSEYDPGQYLKGNANICAALEATIQIGGELAGVVSFEQEKNEAYPVKREWSYAEQSFVSSLADLMAVSIVSQERRKAREAAENANQAKSSFLAKMSHEIRTPMNTILGMTDILLQNEILPTDINEGLERIYTSGDMLLGIINDILDFSKIEAGKMDIAPNQYDVASLINDSVALNMMRVHGRLVEFVLEIDENLPEVMIGDEIRIKQVLNNLLSNAFKYTEKGMVTLTVVAESYPGKDNVMLVFVVRDTGMGMTESQLKNLFSEYSRFHDGKSVEGTGLGLSITQRLVELMQGGIDVKSEQGVGSVFTVRLPQKTVDDRVLGKELASSLERFKVTYTDRMKRGQILRDPMPYGRVLLVDDVEANLYVAEGLMRPYGLKIESVISGFDAIKKTEEGNTYDIIFMDYMMPEMDGMETTKRLREAGYKKPIIALTANAIVGQAEFFMANGFDDFISKPIDIRQLNNILNSFIRDNQSIDAIKAARQWQQDGGGHASPPESGKLKGIEISGMDVQKGILRYNGDEETFIVIMRAYVASVRSMLTVIESFNAEKLDTYRIKVHGIKGASFDLFADDIVEKTTALEAAADRGDIDFIKAHHQAFIDSAWSLVRGIDELLSSLSDSNEKTVKDKPDNELLKKLYIACIGHHMDEVEMAIAEIEQFKYQNDDDLVNWLREAADVLDYDSIADKLSLVFHI